MLGFLDEAERKDLGLHSLMILRHGQVTAEGWWDLYGPTQPHMLFSLSKSFCATAAGLAVSEGLLSLDDQVWSFFDVPAEVGPNLDALLRVRDLLSMSTGHAEDTTGRMRDGAGGDWVKDFLAQPLAYTPGTHFVYNSGATYMVSAIVQKVTGQTVLDYLRPRLFEPLGIANPTWENSPQGINTGGWGLSITTEDIARFGQLYLQKGIWQGKRLLPEQWMAEATSKQVSNGDDPNSDWAQGYGFQFWRCRHDAYRGDGAFGQFCVVLPEQDAVVAMTAGSRDLGGVLNLVWDHLLPAMQSSPLPADPATQAQMAARLANLSLNAPEGKYSSPTAARVSGSTYLFSQDAGADSSITAAIWDFHEDTSVLTIRDGSGEHRIEAGTSEWLRGTTAFGGSKTSPVAAQGAWTTEDTYALTICYYETPFSMTLTAHFAEDRVRLETEQNVSFGPTQRPPLEGHTAKLLA